MQIRHVTPADRPSIWAILEPVIRAGETYALDRDMGEDAALAYWLASEAFVAEDSGGVLGTYYLRRNQAGGGAHVCNCGYMVSAAASGRGVARTMAGRSFEQARRNGYRAMQFNFVISSNERAVRLWRAMGFDEVGRVPGGFAHPRLGYVDALVMHRAL